MYMCIDIAVLTFLPLDKLAAMHSAAACPKKITCPHRKVLLSGLPSIQQNFGVGEIDPKIHDPGGQPTGFEDPCRTLSRRAVALSSVTF